MSPIANAPRAPYALEPAAFPFPALAAMAGRAPLGGPRELALACFLVARIVGAAARDDALSSEQQQARVRAARSWLGSAALPTPMRSALTKLLESTGSGSREAVKSALESVMAVTANQLDSGARLELGRLAQAIVK